MNTTHVFIVDTTTFKIHLEYLFAGTGAGNEYVDFNDSDTTKLHFKRENNLVIMIADSQRIRKGDYIIFYLQQDTKNKIYEGKFYGIFKAKNDLSFLDNNDSNQYLRNKLKKSLTFRTLIEPFEVYPKGVTEWEALDEIKHISSPNQMLWSLIYRKLKGHRGNTMITMYESERLFKLLRDKNNRNILYSKNFTFDYNSQEIIANNINYDYQGRKSQINIIPKLISKYDNNQAFETHLQAYIVQNIGRGINNSLDDCLLGGHQLEWLGNEVKCGVGLQSIDVMLSLVKKKLTKSRIVVPVELKSKEASCENINQLQRYTDWLEQYYIPNIISDIQPVLISKKISNKNNNKFKSIINCFNEFNRKNNRHYPLKYIEFSLENNNLIFEIVNY